MPAEAQRIPAHRMARPAAPVGITQVMKAIGAEMPGGGGGRQLPNEEPMVAPSMTNVMAAIGVEAPDEPAK